MKTWTKLLFGATALTSIAMAAPAMAASLDDTVNFQIAPGSLDEALIAYGKQADLQVISASTAVRGKHTAGVEGAATPREALAMLLKDSGLYFIATGDNTVTVTADPQSGSAAGDGADQGTVAALVVTAQKREENIQDVPIAISAFTEKTLQEQKIEGGFDLLKAIPNVTFSKNNFSSYNFSIRGIGTKAISVTTDPGVAVAFNSTSLIRNRLFEQEYFDVERVEVLRGPQGTLYGRNATAGVINVISAKPNLQEFDGWIKGEVGNYHAKRLSAMVNVPLVGDKLAIRLAGALTDRAGYDFNARTHHAINGRDLWSGRVTLAFAPTEKLRADLIWERFNEDDNRSRTGKQLCHHDSTPTSFGGHDYDFSIPSEVASASYFSQGCKAGSLYDDSAFGTPNGLSMPFVLIAIDPQGGLGPMLGTDQNGNQVAPLKAVDPYGGMMQSRDLRVIDSVRDPIYRAKTDVIELNANWDVTNSLTLTSQTAYAKDNIYSFQDYNRFNTVPIFPDTSGLNPAFSGVSYNSLSPGGIYCDPQIGCADSVAGFDISRAKSTQFSQEFRIQSDFRGPFDFSAGVNYTRYKTLEDYFVFFNLITYMAQTSGVLHSFNASPDITMCQPRLLFGDLLYGIADYSLPPVSLTDPVASRGCVYIDPTPIENLAGDGHNYFRSKNPYKLGSTSAFGEVYWRFSDTLKLTFGLRYTDDRKTFTPVPSQTLLSSSLLLAGTVDRGYPELAAIKQHWGEFSGRLGVDWKPDLAFTDDTLVYAFYSRGYKGGGANPPGIGFNKAACPVGDTAHPCVLPLSYPAVFEPEFVNAYEVGSKNVLLGGGLILNGDVFFYDYKDYQVSQIKDRTAVNENFDSKVWGAELESTFRPTADLRFNLAFGYQDSRIADGEKSIDLMDRTAGDPNYVVVRPFVIMASNCVAALSFAISHATSPASICPLGYQPPDEANLPNGGAGIYKELGGNKLPNAPHWTVSLGAQQSWEITEGWRATVRADGYWQAQSWARVYNAVNDKLHGWYNANLSLWVERPDDGLKIEIYAKNILDKTPITDAFLNSDDTALTTNVFVLDPRLIGLSIRKEF